MLPTTKPRKGRCKWYYGKEGTPDLSKCPYCPDRLLCPASRMMKEKKI